MKHYVVIVAHSGVIYQVNTYKNIKSARRMYRKMIKEYDNPGEDQVMLIEFSDFHDDTSDTDDPVPMTILASGPED